MNSECVYEVYPFEKDMHIRGYFTEDIDNDIIQYIAPSPPDYRASFSGSGLPYANEAQAYEGTPNIGRVILKNNTFAFNIATPNGYYEDFSSKIVSPFVYINYKIGGIEKNLKINLLNSSIPYRSLTHSENYNEMFYLNEDLPIRTQEAILIDSKYPMTNKKNNNASEFWGLKPAC
jgi:hypothetical protein